MNEKNKKEIVIALRNNYHLLNGSFIYCLYCLDVTNMFVLQNYRLRKLFISLNIIQASIYKGRMCIFRVHNQDV